MSSSEDGIVRLRASSGEEAHIGLGFLVAADLVVTCAHVVNACLQRDMLCVDQPSDKDLVSLSFPIVGDRIQGQARVIGWEPPGENGIDCAILRLTHPSPPEVGFTLLSVIERRDMRKDDLSVYGSLEPHHPGTHVSASLSGNVAVGWTQLNIEGQGRIKPGFSGGAIWNYDQRAAIGMVVARPTDHDGTIGYFLSAERITKAFGRLVPVEVRRIPLRQQRWFSCIALLLFGLMLLHFLAERSAEMRAIVPWAGENNYFAAFFGMHMFPIFLGPFVMWTAWLHAVSFRLRPWWQRVPALFGWRPAASLDNTRLGALAVLLFLLILPAYAQGHFVRKALLADTRVYVDRTYFPNADKTKFHSCRSMAERVCQHKAAGLWSVINFDAYFDYAYRIAPPGHDVAPPVKTLFPVLQPLLVIGFTLFAYTYLARLALILLGSPRVPDRFDQTLRFKWRKK